MQSSQPVHLPSLLQLALSGLGLFFFMASTAGLFIAGLFTVSGSTGLRGANALSLFTLGWMSLTICLLLIPSIGYAILRLFGRDGVSWKLPDSFRMARFALIAWPVLLLAGQVISTRPSVDWLLLPPIQVLCVVIPLWFLVELGRRGLRGGSPQRQWGLLSFGIIVTPTLAMVLEIGLLLALGVAAVVWLMQQPQLTNELNRLAQRLSMSPTDNETILRIMRPYLQQPVVIYAMLALLAGIIPLLEELLKPLGVWSIASLRITPAEGFVAGLISGAAFALIETSGVLGGPAVGSTWAGTVIARSGTGVLHTVTAGLSGWGLALAWSKGAYLRLAGIFLLAVTLHAIWNTLGVLMGVYAAFQAPGASQIPILGQISAAAPYALGILAVTMLGILISVNARLKREESGQPIRELVS